MTFFFLLNPKVRRYGALIPPSTGAYEKKKRKLKRKRKDEEKIQIETPQNNPGEIFDRFRTGFLERGITLPELPPDNWDELIEQALLLEADKRHKFLEDELLLIASIIDGDMQR